MEEERAKRLKGPKRLKGTMKYSLEKVIASVKAKGYSLNEDDKKNYNLNIVGIRSNTGSTNSFDDHLYVFWKFNSDWTVRVFPCTTDPGTYWLSTSTDGNPLGAAIVKEGHYPKLWEIGLHQGKYKALKQCNPVVVYRDKDKDGKLDMTPGTEHAGIFGINCHRANENGKSILVDKWSAGCQVLQNQQINNPDNQMVKVFEFDYFMHLCDKKVENHGKYFDYILLNETDIA